MKETGNTQAGPWFISDQAIETPKQDAFGHDDLAKQLAEVVRTVEAPATVGLIGGFGTGKSSIGNLLQAELRSDKKYCVVSLSAEKHTGVARQRALVYSFAEALRDDAGVAEPEIKRLLSRIEVAEDLEGPALREIPLVGFLKENTRELVRAGAAGLASAAAMYASLVVLALVGRVLGVTEVNPLTWPVGSAALLLPVVTFLGGATLPAFTAWLRAAVTPGTARWSRPRAEAADELERVFGDLAGKVSKRLVILVDDVDRLPPGEVLEALNSIKTFQRVPRDRPPIFVIACDDRIVARAIEQAPGGDRPAPVPGGSAADEYLNKLFSVRQPLPPHLKRDMDEYAERLLRDLDHAGVAALGDDLRDVLQILMHEGVSDPRHVIRLLNAFFVDYRLAATREVSGGRLGAGEVTGRPALLARLTVLKVDYPTTYEAVRRDFALLEALDLHLTSGSLDEAQEHLVAEFGPLESGLDNFLLRTMPYVPQDVPLGPFFYLGQSSAGRALGSSRAEQFRVALVNNNVARFRELLADAASVHAVDQTITTLTDARIGQPQSNAVRVAAAALEDVPDDDRGRLANELAAIVTRDRSTTPGPREVAAVALHADRTYTDALLSNLTSFDEEEDLKGREQRARAILELAVRIPDSVVLVRSLERYFDDLPATADWADADGWLLSLIHI